MALILADRVRELTATTGTGSVTLIGSPDGFETFAASIGDGNTTYYTIADKTGDNWEVGVGTYRSTGNLLERTTVLSSSNGGNKVAFTAGDKDVFVTLPAEKTVSSDSLATVATTGAYADLTGKPTLGSISSQNADSVVITGGAIDGTTIGSTTPAAAMFTTLTATSGSFQAAGANAGLTMLRNTDASSSSTRIFLDSSGGVSTIYNGGNNIRFHTGANPGVSSGVMQFQVAPTSSAVNYVQVTGGATSASASALPGILFTGSDASVNAAIVSKGNAYIAFAGNASSASQAFRVVTTNSASTGNLIAVQGAAAGSAPSIQAISGTSGTDTNIDLALTPKGTGLVRFGTYTAGAPTATGYISIKAANGTTYKVLVGT